MTPADDDALAVVRADKRFLQLPVADRDRVLAGALETKRRIENARQEDRYGDRPSRLRHYKALRSHLKPIVKILEDEVAAFDAADWLVGYHRGYVFSAMDELKAFHATARRLLDGAFEPDSGRKERGEPRLNTELRWQAFCKLLELLEGVGIRVGKTGKFGRTTGEGGGPGSRLLSKLITYAVGFDVSVGAVKALMLQLRKVG